MFLDPMKPGLLLTLLAAASFAGAADAQTLQPLRLNGAGAIQSVADASDLRSAVFIPYAQANAMKDTGESKTEIDRRFGRNGLTGSLGYLCGVNSSAPGADVNGGPASSFGHGTTFLGAKISLPFR